tara:strand:+ start:1447 stop:1794 length:348 start_codon:yes stop_codon:yes gene_type:complete
MDKKALQNKVNELKLTLGSLELNAKSTQEDLMEATKKLEDVSKPIITKEFVEQIREAVHQAIQQISFNSVDSYDVDFEIDYNNSLALANIEFNEVDEINETVCAYIEDLFNIIEE